MLVRALIVAFVSQQVNLLTIMFGVDKRLPYDFLGCTQAAVYEVVDFVQSQLKVFSGTNYTSPTLLRVTSNTNEPFQIRSTLGTQVMIRVSERSSKLSLQFVGPCEVVKYLGGHKQQVRDRNSNSFEIVHSLKETRAKFETADIS